MADYKIKAQVAIEFIVALLCLFVFFVAITKLFVWFGHNLVERDKAYSASRVTFTQDLAAGKNPSLDIYKPAKLNIFSDWHIFNWRE